MNECTIMFSHYIT